MMLRHFSILLVIAIPALGFTQISVYDADYRLEADARSGSSTDSQLAFNNSMGPVQNFFNQVDAFASQLPSTVHSWSNVSWNCTPTDLDVGLVACWDSQDLGAGNSGHMLSRLTLGLRLTAVNLVSTVGAFDPSNSSAAIDMLVGSTWVPLVTSSQIVSYSGVWNPGDYRLRAQRLYNPVGNSTGCVPLSLHLQAVPEPASILALSAGVALLLRRRRARVTG